MNRFDYTASKGMERAVRPGQTYLHRDGRTVFTILARGDNYVRLWPSERGFWETSAGCLSEVFILRHCKRELP